MPFKDELEFEKALVKLLTDSCGWEPDIIYNPTEEDLIDNWKQILFDNNRERNVLNDIPLSDNEMRQILSKINELKSPLSLNKFINGKSISITRDGDSNDILNRGKTVSLKIYDRMEIAGGKSRYQIVEQPVFKTKNDIYPKRRGDIMLLINGMPVIHVELKRTGVSITEAEVQIEKYMANKCYRGIFSLVQLFVAMNPEDAVYYANPGENGTFQPEYYFHWEDFNNDIIHDWKTFASKVLSIPMAHEMIGFYTIPDDSDGKLKVMRSYQYYAASAITDRVSRSSWTKADQHGGYVWHTTGSGKTMTSFKAAQLIANSKYADKVVFLLDRIELGDQSLINYRNFANDDESIQDTDNTDILIHKLKSDDYDDTLIVTSIQKMSRIREDNDVGTSDLKKIKSKKIVFVIDECHRDQKGEMHQNIKITFPNAIYFGFTGTPDLKYTSDIFGDELHRYTISHGIRDENVLGFDPTPIMTLNEDELREKIALHECKAKSVEEAMGDEKKKKVFLYWMNKSREECPMIEVESKIPSTQYSPAYDENKPTKHMEVVASDIIKNWTIRSLNSKFHGIFATSSIKEAIIYYNLFKNSGCNIKVTAIFDPSDNNSNTAIEKMNGITDILDDYNKMFHKGFNINSYASFKKDVCARLSHKKPYFNVDNQERLDLVIVVDQLLTGFDSKWINTLYLDKLLRGMNFIQAASRTNRLFGIEKPFGNIFWYRYPYTMDKNLQDAMNDYSGNRAYDIFVNKLDKNINGINKVYEEIIEMYKSAGIINFERISNDIDWKKQYAKKFADLQQFLNSAKMQGFNWRTSEYSIEHFDGSVVSVKCNLDEFTYTILLQRYKELFPSGGEKSEGIPYDVDTNIVKLYSERIDNNYINSKFKLFIKELSNNSPQAKEKALKDLHNTFALLSVENQKYARQFLLDIESGNAVLDEDKSFMEYITDYKVNAFNNKIHQVAVGLGVDEEMLKDMMNSNLTETDINKFGRYDELKKGINIEKANVYLEGKLNRSLSKIETIIESDKLLREYIINGGLDGD